MTGYQKYTQDQRDESRRLFLAEVSVREIAIAVKAPQANIRYWVRDLVPEINQKKAARLEEAKSMVKDGKSLKEAVETTGLSYQTVYNRTKAIRGTRKHHSRELIMQAVGEFHEGIPAKTISHKYDIPIVTVYSWIRRLRRNSEETNVDQDDLKEREAPKAVSEPEENVEKTTISFFDLGAGVNVSVDDEDDYSALEAFEKKLLRKSRLRLVEKEKEAKRVRVVFDLWGQASKAQYDD